ncbi:MAG: DoxX family protein [Myxococcus sp.]|nr:DoxX family protein [Myxococcus sp.]
MTGARLGRGVALGFFVVVFGVGGLNHFRDPAFYVAMMPPFLPLHDALVALSGVTELVTAALLLVPFARFFGAVLVVLHLVVFLVVHVFMVVRPELWPAVPVAALWARLVVQGLAIALAVWLSRALRPQT